jgi:hypothetical protein
VLDKLLSKSQKIFPIENVFDRKLNGSNRGHTGKQIALFLGRIKVRGEVGKVKKGFSQRANIVLNSSEKMMMKTI